MTRGTPMNVALALTAEMVGSRLREHDSELGKVAAQMAAQELRLDALEAENNLLHGRIAALETDVERLESARISPQEAPESVEAMLRLPEEPGNATGQICDDCGQPLVANGQHRSRVEWADCRAKREVAAALRVYRKVRTLTPNDDGSVWVLGHYEFNAAQMLAWLKEGEA